jgi:hypothetical protein
MYDGNFDEKRFDFLIACMWEEYGCGCCGDDKAMKQVIAKLRKEVFNTIKLKDITIKHYKDQAFGS